MTRREFFSRRRRVWWAVMVGIWSIGGAGAAPAPKPAVSPSASPAPAAAAAPSPSPTPAPGLTLNDIAPRGQETLAALKGFESEAEGSQTVGTVEEALPTLTKSIDDLHDQSTKATANAGSSLDSLRNLQVGWKKLTDALVEHSDTLGARGRALETQAGKLKEINTLWNATLQVAEAKDANAPPETTSLVREVIYNALLADTRLRARQNKVLDLQNRVGALLTRANAGQEAVEAAIGQAVKTLLVRDSPPLWSPDAQPRADLAGRGRAAYTEQVGQIQTYADQNESTFVVHLLVFGGLAALFLSLRRLIHRWTEDEPHLKRAAPIFEVPTATALAVSFLAMGNQYAGAPSLLHAGIAAAALLPTVVILRRLLSRRLFPVLYSLVAFTVTDQIRVATAAFPAVNRWLFCAEMTAAAGVFLWLLRAQQPGPKEKRVGAGRFMPFLCGAAVSILVGALGASVLGYARLGALLGTATLNSSYCAVFFYAALRVLDGLIMIALRVRPVSASRIAQTHRDQVQAQVYTLFRAVAVLLWLRYTLEQLQLAKPLTKAVGDTLTYKVVLGQVHFSLDQFLYFGVAVSLSLLVSRVLRFFLNEEVYERVQLAPGLPYAISTMLNYAVLLVGFAIAIGLLGIPLTQISIVAGAFSVGLGFGLQNIINNFVSGIILLFERPVKVGDVIQLGDATGEVRRIGIRASIIRTRDGSDIILPNGNLISNQVTNWTYADRQRAVEVTLNIAAGPDPNHVLSVLKAAANREPATPDQPVPEAYITALLPNGFTVVVRAWTGRDENWIEVRSELSVTLIGVLGKENIKLV